MSLDPFRFVGTRSDGVLLRKRDSRALRVVGIIALSPPTKTTAPAWQLCLLWPR